MTEKYVRGKIVMGVGKVMIAFKAEAPESEIEKVLAQYEHEKVFKNGEIDGSRERKNEVLDRLYVLAVPAGTEATVVEELKSKYDPLIQYTHQPAVREPRR